MEPGFDGIKKNPLFRTFPYSRRFCDIMGFHFETYMLDKADVVIHPRVGSLHWTEFALARDLVREGERAAREKLHLLRKTLPLSRRWALLSSLEKSFTKNN